MFLNPSIQRYRPRFTIVPLRVFPTQQMDEGDTDFEDEFDDDDDLDELDDEEDLDDDVEHEWEEVDEDLDEEDEDELDDDDDFDDDDDEDWDDTASSFGRRIYLNPPYAGQSPVLNT